MENFSLSDTITEGIALQKMGWIHSLYIVGVTRGRILGSMFFLFFFLILWGILPLHSQPTSLKPEIPDILWGRDEEFDTSDFSDGSLISTPSDFILARGKQFQGNPPPSYGEFTFRGKKIQNSGEFNNQAVALLEKGDSKSIARAKQMLQKGVQFDPMFFPFRYNLGRIHQMEKEYEKAIVQFEYARREVPDYYRTYIHIGQLSEITREPHYAVEMYKIAVTKNPLNNVALLHLAEFYLANGLKNRAYQYIQRALEVDEESPNAKLALARLKLDAKQEYHAYKIFKKTNLETPEGKPREYEKKLHFYYAEAASIIGDYEKAEEQYNILLQFPNDPFFSGFSYKAVERRRDIAKKFALAKQTQAEDAQDTED